MKQSQSPLDAETGGNAPSGSDDAALLLPPPGVEPLQQRAGGQYLGRLLRRDEVDRAIQLYREASFSQLTPKQWDWRFFGRNPRMGILPAVFHRDGRLIAIYPVTFRPVWIRGRELMAGQACNTLVHPEFRGGGRVYLFLMKFTFDVFWSHGLHFGYGGGATEEAMKVGAKLSTYRPLLELTVRERRLSLRLALGRRFGEVGALGARVLDASRRRTASRRHGGFELQTVAAAGPEFDELWRRKRGRYVVAVRRDARELDWRWFANPVPSQVIAARRDGRLEGYVVLRHHPDTGGPARLSTVIDLFSGQEPEVDAALLAAAAREAGDAGSDFLHFAPAPRSSAFPQVQAKPWRPARKEVDRVLVARCSYDPGQVGIQAEFDTVMDGANWYYCQGDSDFLD
ncbi:MAG: hypothetical protein EYC70_12270 [Planctomycetota bacterium]|nr:MAG: hypothetical protein EYC70_12270 [Planctomycetota bacterium]